MLTYSQEQKQSLEQTMSIDHEQKDMSHHRRLSHHSDRGFRVPRSTDGTFDTYYLQRHRAYSPPLASIDRARPIPSQNDLDSPLNNCAGSSRLTPGYDAYNGQPRRPRPAVVQIDSTRPSSPPRRGHPDYYVQPSASAVPERSRQYEHKKTYSVDDDGAKLVADIDRARVHHRRPAPAHGGRERAPESGETFSYLDPASMYKDTEPKWREARPQRGSIERGGAGCERTSSVERPSRRETRQRRGSIERTGISRERPYSMPKPYETNLRPRYSSSLSRQRGWQQTNGEEPAKDSVQLSPSRSRTESQESHTDERSPHRRDSRPHEVNVLSPSAKVAAGGLGAAATLFGLNREKGKREQREREEQEYQRDWYRDSKFKRPCEQDRDEYKEETSKDEYTFKKPKMPEQPPQLTRRDSSSNDDFADLHSDTSRSVSSAKACSDEALETDLVVGDMDLDAEASEPADTSSTSDNYFDDGTIGREGKEVTARALLSRWLCDSASAAFLEVTCNDGHDD